VKDKMTSQEIAQALTVFIKSGSANGNEAMRKNMLSLVPVFSAALEMLEALKASIEAAERIDEEGGFERAMKAKQMTLEAIALPQPEPPKG
jgi:hypothetical protein